jgi:hypothetical protein
VSDVKEDVTFFFLPQNVEACDIVENGWLVLWFDREEPD